MKHKICDCDFNSLHLLFVYVLRNWFATHGPASVFLPLIHICVNILRISQYLWRMTVTRIESHRIVRIRINETKPDTTQFNLTQRNARTMISFELNSTSEINAAARRTKKENKRDLIFYFWLVGIEQKSFR